jgi:hypothetical protein
VALRVRGDLIYDPASTGSWAFVVLPHPECSIPIPYHASEHAREESPFMAVRFPSLEFFQALQQRTKDEAVAFEKLGYCDTTFGVRVGDELFNVAFEIYECVEVGSGGEIKDLDFVLSAPLELWREMLESVQANDGADAAHTLNTLTPTSAMS